MRNIFQVTGFDETSKEKHNLSIGTRRPAGKPGPCCDSGAYCTLQSEVRKQVKEMCSRFTEVYISADIKCA